LFLNPTHSPDKHSKFSIKVKAAGNLRFHDLTNTLNEAACLGVSGRPPNAACTTVNYGQNVPTRTSAATEIK
jgi:hypothetical protein